MSNRPNNAGRRRALEIRTRVDSRPDKMAEIVARKLANDILSRGLGEGASLDAEQALIERFAVSRESIREAQRLLEVAGLITIRRGPGGGAFVGTVDPSNLGRFASLYYNMAGATYGELFDAYSTAEGILASRAARATNAAARRAAMAPYLDDHRESDDLAQFIKHHAGFHSAVAGLAGNRVLQITMESIGMVVARHYVALAESHHLTLDAARADRPFVERDHLAIARAISAGRHHQAADLMEDHVHQIVTVLESDGLRRGDVIEWV